MPLVWFTMKYIVKWELAKVNFKNSIISKATFIALRYEDDMAQQRILIESTGDDIFS